MNIPPRTPKITEEFKKVARPTKGEKEVTKSKEESAQRAKDKEKDKATKVSDKAFGERSSSAVEGVSPADVPALPAELLSFIGEFSDTRTAAAISETSEALYKLAQETDLKKLQEFRENHKLGMKEEMALLILQIVAQTGSMPTIEEIKKKAMIDTSLTPEEAAKQLKKIEANYQEIQSVFNQILNSAATTFAPDAAEFLLWNTFCHSPIILLSVLILAMSTPVTIATLFFNYKPPSDDTHSIIPALLSVELAFLPYSICLSAIPTVYNMYNAASIATFRTAATNIMTSLTQKLGL